VRMIAAENGAYGVGALSVSLVGRKTVFVHRVEYAAVNGLQPVADVGQRALRYDRHRIVEEGLAHLLVKLYIDYLLIEQMLLEVVLLSLLIVVFIIHDETPSFP